MSKSKEIEVLLQEMYTNPGIGWGMFHLVVLEEGMDFLLASKLVEWLEKLPDDHKQFIISNPGLTRGLSLKVNAVLSLVLKTGKLSKGEKLSVTKKFL